MCTHEDVYIVVVIEQGTLSDDAQHSAEPKAGGMAGGLDRVDDVDCISDEGGLLFLRAKPKGSANPVLGPLQTLSEQDRFIESGYQDVFLRTGDNTLDA